MDGALLYSYTIDSGNIPQNFIGRRQQQLSYLLSLNMEYI